MYSIYIKICVLSSWPCLSTHCTKIVSLLKTMSVHTLHKCPHDHACPYTTHVCDTYLRCLKQRYIKVERDISSCYATISCLLKTYNSKIQLLEQLKMPKHKINMSLYDTITMLAYYFFCLGSEVIQHPYEYVMYPTNTTNPIVFYVFVFCFFII